MATVFPLLLNLGNWIRNIRMTLRSRKTGSCAISLGFFSLSQVDVAKLGMPPASHLTQGVILAGSVSRCQKSTSERAWSEAHSSKARVLEGARQEGCAAEKGWKERKKPEKRKAERGNKEEQGGGSKGEKGEQGGGSKRVREEARN